jgi:hypothetical protein
MSVTRRQFGQLAIAGTAATALGVFATRGIAQTSGQLILGVRPGALPKIDKSTNLTENSSIDDAEESTTASITVNTENNSERSTENGKVVRANGNRSIVVESYDLATSQVTTVLTTSAILLPGEQLSGFATLKDGTLIVAASGGGLSKKSQTNSNIRLIFLSDLKTLTLSGLKDRQELLSLARSGDNSLIGIVSDANGAPPYSLVAVNPKTGEVTVKSQLPGKAQYSNLTECVDGALYAIATEKSGITSLYQIKEGQTNPLKLDGQPWNSGFIGLVCSASNQLFAVGARRYEFPNYIHLIDTQTGNLKRLTAFDVSKIAIS